MLRENISRFRGILRKLGCFAPGSTIHVRPKGASVHYSGTVPMSSEPAPLTCSSQGRSHDFQNLYFVDGTSFPYLPAKNLTFTLMANAARIADLAF
jgi:choline dehydrogenase-like flavoprotein